MPVFITLLIIELSVCVSENHTQIITYIHFYLQKIQIKAGKKQRHDAVHFVCMNLLKTVN